MWIPAPSSSTRTSDPGVSPACSRSDFGMTIRPAASMVVNMALRYQQNGRHTLSFRSEGSIVGDSGRSNTGSCVGPEDHESAAGHAREGRQRRGETSREAASCSLCLDGCGVRTPRTRHVDLFVQFHLGTSAKCVAHLGAFRHIQGVGGIGPPVSSGTAAPQRPRLMAPAVEQLGAEVEGGNVVHVGFRRSCSRTSRLARSPRSARSSQATNSGANRWSTVNGEAPAETPRPRARFGPSRRKRARRARGPTNETSRRIGPCRLGRRFEALGLHDREPKAVAAFEGHVTGRDADSHPHGLRRSSTVGPDHGDPCPVPGSHPGGQDHQRPHRRRRRPTDPE